MDSGWRLGPHGYGEVARLSPPGGGPGCTWAVVRRDGEGPRNLLQVWDPCPPGGTLDGLREEFLQRFSRAEAMDPGACHLGFDQGKAWCLQELVGTPLPRLWAQADRSGRLGLAARLRSALGEAGAPRFLAPDLIGLDPGRVLAPRILGAANWDPAAAREGLLDQMERAAVPLGAGGGERPWDQPPELADSSRLPLRGRARELTYLKSLVLGLRRGGQGERILLLQGEGGLGHDRLCDWAGAVAETEGLWVANLDIYPGEDPGGLLERVVAELIAGLEAELFAHSPAVARALSRRLASFAFLKGGHRGGERRIDPEETSAALDAMAFAQARHPRMVVLRSLERAAAEVPRLVLDLVAGSGIPWVLSARDPGLGPEAKACITALRHHPDSATVILDRLEDGQIGEMLEDLLGPHDLPPGLRADLCAASLGNPGLLQKTLEMAQMKCLILPVGGRWTCAPGQEPVLEPQEDLVAGILLGRLRRLHPAALAAVRCLALVDEPLGFATLGRALGLDVDAMEEALHPAANAKLILAADGSARISGTPVRDLAIAHMAPREILRGAQALLKILDGESGRPLPAVRLLAFALDRETALARVLQGVERERAGPRKAQLIVREALKLGPGPLQEARLWEFQADAWGWASAGDGLSLAGPRDRSPLELALEALDQAIRTLGAGDDTQDETIAARLHRKRGLLELRLRRLEAAGASLRAASALLADHPFHPEQPRLCLAQGRLEFGRGALDPAVAALRAGLDLLDRAAEPDRHDRAALLLELGRAQGEGAQFHAAMATLAAARALAEQDGDPGMLAEALGALGQVHLAMGQADPAGECLLEALVLARSQDDPALVAQCQLHLGMLRSAQQLLGPALASLESAARRFELLGDGPRAAQAQVWKARNLAALGDHGMAELLLMRLAGAGTGPLTPVELGERVFLDAETAGFMDDWASARRDYQAAANRFAHAGLLWRERLTRLRCIQAEAQEASTLARTQVEPAWIRLEQLKGPVEASGSRWLELEWQRAHALLLSCGPGAPGQALTAWAGVLAGARELGFPAVVLEAATRCAEFLLDQGDPRGARARIEEALPSAQELWARLPEPFRKSFLERNDLHRFQRAGEHSGMNIPWPEPGHPLPGWNPTTVDLSLAPPFPGDP